MMIFLTLSLLAVTNRAALAQAISSNAPWAYLLLDDSYLIDDCPVCGRPVIQEPMRGTFDLRLVEQNPIVSRYAVENLQFKAGSAREYIIKGSGTFELGGQLAVIQQMFLQVEIDDGVTNKLCFLTNSTATVERPWPMIDVQLDQTNGTLTQVFRLRLAAAPVRELWFSTVNGFTSAHGQPPANSVSAGDLISSSGRIVKRNQALTAQLGIMPSVPDLGLDGMDVVSGGEIAFSIEQDVFSETLGQIQQGDLLSQRGRILRRNQDLLAAFAPQPGLADAGLDAVQSFDNGEVFFSIETNTFSQQLGVTLQSGDVLSSTGRIVRSNQQLLARFQPTNATKDFGLDALYIWLHGETWFSTEVGFQDQTLGPIQPGDLLSDSGYVVFRNLELLNAFAPVEDLADFGLDAVFVVTDAILPAPTPRFLSIQSDGALHSVGMRWEGPGRVFQVERAVAVAGSLFLPVSAILPDVSFDDLGALTNRSQGYYRLRQW